MHLAFRSGDFRGMPQGTENLRSDAAEETKGPGSLANRSDRP